MPYAQKLASPGTPSPCRSIADHVDAASLNPEEQRVLDFLKTVERDQLRMKQLYFRALWAYTTNITEETQEKQRRAEVKKVKK